MFKKYIIFAILFLLAGCTVDDGARNFPLDFAPDTATKIKTYSVDFEGDKVKEDILYYKNKDHIDEPFADELWILHEYVDVYRQINEEYKNLMSLSYPHESYYHYREGEAKPSGVEIKKISNISIVDIGSDLKEELFIWERSGDLDSPNYTIIGYQNDEIRELEHPKGFDNKTPGMRLEDTGEFYGRLISVRIDEGKIVEHWGGTCEGGVQPCYFFDFFITYDSQENKWSISKAQNIKKDEGEYQKYLDRYSDAMTWTDELPF